MYAFTRIAELVLHHRDDTVGSPPLPERSKDVDHPAGKGRVSSAIRCALPLLVYEGGSTPPGKREVRSSTSLAIAFLLDMQSAVQDYLATGRRGAEV